MKYIIISSIFLSVSVFSFSQIDLTLEWTRTEGDTVNISSVSKIIIDKYGNPCVCGETYSIGPITGYLTVKYDSTGNNQWINHFDELGQDILRDCLTDDSGNIIVGGESSSTPGSGKNILLFKYSVQGEELWSYSFESTANETASFSDMMIDANQNIYVIGRTYNADNPNLRDLLVVKLDSFGNQIWEWRLGEPNERVYSGRVGRILEDKIAVLGISSGTPEGAKYHIFQLSFDGEVLSATENFATDDFAGASIFDQFGNLIIGDPAREYKVAKINFEGDTAWFFKEPIIGPSLPPPSVSARLTELISDEDGNIYASGSHYHEDTYFDILTTKLDSAGNVLWQSRFMNTGEYLSDTPHDIFFDKNYVYVVGRTATDSINRDMVLIVYSNETGEELASVLYDHVENSSDVANSVIVKDNAIYITGTTREDSESPTLLVTQKYTLDIQSSFFEQEKSEFVIYPNPTSKELNVKGGKGELILFNQMGTEVNRFDLGNNNRFALNLPLGIYFYQIIEGEQFRKAGKLIISQ